MVKRSRGSLSKSTKKMKKKKEITVSALVKPFAIGEKVVLETSHLVEGRIPRRYRGMHGTVVEKRGRSYVVEILDGGKKKQIITNPAFLKKV
jgi:large subunit ribosomal protein L21e